MPPAGAAGASASRIPAPRANGEAGKPGIGSGLYVADGPGLWLCAPKIQTTFEVRNTSGAPLKVSSGPAAFAAAEQALYPLASPPCYVHSPLDIQSHQRYILDYYARDCSMRWLRTRIAQHSFMLAGS